MANDLTLWAVRREFGIKDDDKGGWKKLSAALVDKYAPMVDDHQLLASLLMGLPDEKKKRGPKVKWTPEDMSHLLFLIDDFKKQSSNPGETDASIIERRLEEFTNRIGIVSKTLKTRTAKARALSRAGKLPPYTNPDNSR